MKLDLVPWIIVVTLGVLLMWETNSHVGTRSEFAAYKGRVEQLAEAQQAQIEKDKQQAEENIRQVRKDYEEKLPAIRDAAVRNYRLRYPYTCGSPVPGNAASVQVDDGAGKEPVADEFVRACAEDAAKVTAFQDYCKRNNCPVEE